VSDAQGTTPGYEQLEIEKDPWPADW
jgi:hypothetical protein